MVRSVHEGTLSKFSFSEGIENGVAGINWTLGLCRHHEFFFYGSYNALEETLNYLKSLKINSFPGGNVTD